MDCSIISIDSADLMRVQPLSIIYTILLLYIQSNIFNEFRVYKIVLKVIRHVFKMLQGFLKGDNLI